MESAADSFLVRSHASSANSIAWRRYNSSAPTWWYACDAFLFGTASPVPLHVLALMERTVLMYQPFPEPLQQRLKQATPPSVTNSIRMESARLQRSRSLISTLPIS